MQVIIIIINIVKRECVNFLFAWKVNKKNVN